MSSVLGLSQKQFTKVIMWLKNIKCPIGFEFQVSSLTLWTRINSWISDNQIEYSACPKDKWIGK